MGYFDWHREPGYSRDITRHFRAADRVLDVGCGTAWLSRHFADYTGIDDSSDAVTRARAAGINAIQCSANTSLPFPDSSFDAVILKDVLEHLDDPIATVREAWRVLRPGGRVFASSPDAQRWVWDDYTHRRPFSRLAFKRMFADAGFDVEVVGYESVSPGSSIVSHWTGNRRPRVLGLLAWLPVIRRNVWALASRPSRSV